MSHNLQVRGVAEDVVVHALTIKLEIRLLHEAVDSDVDEHLITQLVAVSPLVV